MAAATVPSNGSNPGPNAVSMDIDMDIDLGPEPEFEPDAEPIRTDTVTHESAIDPLDEEAVYEKVHVRGVDDLTTDNIKQFATSHFSQEIPSRVEWIDDTSANLVYSSSDIGLQALAALTQVTEEEEASALPPLRLRSAKLLASHPDSVLQVRSAVKTDRKQARAHEKSRFYLMHPEHDPRERLRQELSDRRRGDTGEGEYRRRRFDDHELRRRRDRDQSDTFSANMYDEQPASYSDSERAGRRGRGPRELFPDDEESSGRLRNRSASPGRDTLEDADRMNRAHDGRRRFRERSAHTRRNAGRELLTSKGDSDPSARELFPNKPTSSYIKKELFPTKTSHHRRSDAFDASDETPDSLARRITAPGQRNRNIELFPESGGDVQMEDQGFAMRGISKGLSIKGRGAPARELLPSQHKTNNTGKELFGERLEGRGGRRHKAEDLFG